MSSSDSFGSIRRPAAIPVVFYTAHYGEREATGAGAVERRVLRPDETGRVRGGAEDRRPRALRRRGRAMPPMPLRSRRHSIASTCGCSPTNSRRRPADLRTANARLRALINIGLELASERDSERLLQSVCVAARDLFGATYVTLGIVDRNDRTVQRSSPDGAGRAAAGSRPATPSPGLLETVVAERRTVRGDNPGGDPAGLQLPVAPSGRSRVSGRTHRVAGACLRLDLSRRQ